MDMHTHIITYARTLLLALVSYFEIFSVNMSFNQQTISVMYSYHTLLCTTYLLCCYVLSETIFASKKKL